VKFLFSPFGLILIVAILAFFFWPRRTPDAIKKRMGRPMRAFSDDEAAAPKPVDEAKPAESAKDAARNPESDPSGDPPSTSPGG
jgi:Sec-independent protein translocase protein TatA